MPRTTGVGVALGRAVVGALAGAIFCLTLTALLGEAFAYHPADDQAGLRLFLAACGVGGTAGAALAAVAGGKEVRGKARGVSVGMAAGALVGILAAAAYGFLAGSASGNPVSRAKTEPALRLWGLLVGVPAGTVLGGLLGLWIGIRRGQRKVAR